MPKRKCRKEMKKGNAESKEAAHGRRHNTKNTTVARMPPKGTTGIRCRGKEERAGLKFREQDEEAGCRDDATKMHNEERDSIPRNYQERRT
jgi:hypothetical protein